MGIMKMSVYTLLKSLLQTELLQICCYLIGREIVNVVPFPVRILVTGYADMNAVIDSINMGGYTNILLSLT